MYPSCLTRQTVHGGRTVVFPLACPSRSTGRELRIRQLFLRFPSDLHLINMGMIQAQGAYNCCLAISQFFSQFLEEAFGESRSFDSEGVLDIVDVF